jgi:integrase
VLADGDARAVLPRGQQRGVILRLRQTKTGRGAGRLQEAVVEDAGVVWLLTDLVRRTPADKPLFGCASTAAYRRLFRAAVSALRLPAALVPHSLRHGGATYLSARGLSVDEIMRRGRWMEARTCRTYIQHLRARLHALAIPQSLTDAGWLLAAHLPLALSLAQRKYLQGGVAVPLAAL